MVCTCSGRLPNRSSALSVSVMRERAILKFFEAGLSWVRCVNFCGKIRTESTSGTGSELISCIALTKIKAKTKISWQHSRDLLREGVFRTLQKIAIELCHFRAFWDGWPEVEKRLLRPLSHHARWT